MPMSKSFEELAARVRNWGRWGADDERGTVNLIDAAARQRGAAAVRTGRVFALGFPLSPDGLQGGFVPGRDNPTHTVHQVNEALSADPDGVRANDDHIAMALQCATHWDALAHVSYGGKLYNGFPSSTVTERGAARCGIDKIGTIISRGVLLDVARAKGVDRLEGGYAITGDDLDAAAELARVTVEPGDVVLCRTGQTAFLHQDPPDRLGYVISAAGPSSRSVQWFRDHDVAAVATDTMAFEVYPWEDPDLMMPVHLLHLVEMGLTQGQNWDLEQLAADCADDGVYEFLLDATPQPIEGGVGSPVQPVAVK